MHFYYIYKALAHPENNGYVPPFTLQERLLHVAEARKQLGTRIRFICDTMDNDLKHALGDRPNSEFVIDPVGRIVVARQWSDPAELRSDLERLIGPVERPTKVSDLNMKPLAPPKTAARGVVPRLKLSGQMQPVRVEPIVEDSDDPFYVKLRAETDSGFAQTGYGKLYLGFFLDPLYKVHWNNRAAPVSYHVLRTTGIDVADLTGKGPDIAVDADADPREFLLDLCSDRFDDARHQAQEILLEVRYFACDDAETFCRPVTQTYRVVLERDRDGGSRRSAGNRNRGRNSRLPGNSVNRPDFSRMTEAERRAMRQQILRRRNESR